MQTLMAMPSDIKHLFDTSSKCRTRAVRLYRIFVRSNSLAIEQRYYRTVIRQREAVVSALSAIETAEFDELAVSAADAEALSAAAQRPRLQLVAGSPSPFPAGPNVLPAERGRPAARRRPVTATPVRLTRRGRIVLGALVVGAVTLVITLVSMAVSGAQAANHGQPGGGYQGMHQIVVRPGQSLWSIAEQAEPTADPRLVEAQIMTANSMTSSSVLQAGELLWVPR
jgi:hypothetical protein